MLKLTVRREYLYIIPFNALLIVLIALGELAMPVFSLLRIGLGLLYTLFIPGYILHTALFPRKDELDGIERLAFSFGLSIALITLQVLILEWASWGVRIWPIIISQMIVIVLFSVLTELRRRHLLDDERYTLQIEFDVKGPWERRTIGSRVLLIILFLAIATAVGSGLVMLNTPKASDTYTEFFLLGAEQLGDSYPTVVSPEAPITVTVGITNMEGDAVTYSLVIQSDTAEPERIEAIRLAPSEQWLQEIRYTLPDIGEDQQVNFLLYREDFPTEAPPYRSLHLWIDVREPEL